MNANLCVMIISCLPNCYPEPIAYVNVQRSQKTNKEKHNTKNSCQCNMCTLVQNHVGYTAIFSFTLFVKKAMFIFN